MNARPQKFTDMPLGDTLGIGSALAPGDACGEGSGVSMGDGNDWAVTTLGTPPPIAKAQASANPAPRICSFRFTVDLPIRVVAERVTQKKPSDGSCGYRLFHSHPKSGSNQRCRALRVRATRRLIPAEEALKPSSAEKPAMAARINTGRLTALLALWIALLIAPGALEVLGTFGHFDVNSSIEGPIIGIWVVGYLVQFAVFMLISRIVDPGFPAWFAASALPWAIDWTTPVSPLFGLLWVAIAVAIAVWIFEHARRDETLREHGVHATGVVLQVFQPFMNVIINGAYIKRKLQLRIEGVPGVAAYEATMSGLFMFGDVPSVGDRLPLLVDSQNPQRFEADDSSSSSGTIADGLGKLAGLRAQGALTDAEFDAAKKQLLN